MQLLVIHLDSDLEINMTGQVVLQYLDPHHPNHQNPKIITTDKIILVKGLITNRIAEILQRTESKIAFLIKIFLQFLCNSYRQKIHLGISHILKTTEPK